MSIFYHDTKTFVDTDAGNFGPIEPGQYLAMITEAGERVSNTTGATYAYVKIEILEGKFKGRKVFDNMFLNSANAKAVSIAKKKLHAICVALGISELTDPSLMLFKQMHVKVALDKQDMTKNIVMGYGMPFSAAHMVDAANQAASQIANEIPF